jgi:prepilin-type N-terminal cleavage/methylation domain-containing protein/prepilin-type processing-associated H-X9-DG protein
MQHSHNSRKKGFTLIELLVVIAIIAILAAILFPVFARARENARRASCQSNLKQIALGVFMYNQDYDEELPTITVNTSVNYEAALTAGNASSAPYGWADALQPYLKSTQIFQCPSENVGPNVDATLGEYTDYWINGNAAGKADAQFDAPAVTVLLGDGQGGSTSAATGTGSSSEDWIGSSRYVSYGGSPAACAGAATAVPAVFGPGAHRHLTGANIAFADGHVKWEKGVSDTSSTSAGIMNECWGTANGVPTFKTTDANS